MKERMVTFIVFNIVIFFFFMCTSNLHADNPFTVKELNISGIVDVAPSNSELPVETEGAVAGAVEKKELGYGFVRVNTRLNVRTGPWGKIIGKLYDGDKLKVISREGDWLKIHYNGGVAYVHSHYVEIGSGSGTLANNSSGSTNSSNSNSGNTPVGEVPAGTMNPGNFGYSGDFKSVFDIVEKFCASNEAYVFGAGHTKKSGYTGKTDCSGFVGQFIQKMAAMSGISPVFPKDSWYPSSQVYKTKHTNKISSTFPPTNPKDLIRPGDVFVMNPGASGVGHVGLFMGYTPSGQPIIAHSTSARVKSSTKVSGKVGTTGVRIEALPSRYRSRWAGTYRIKNMDQMLNKLSS